jgi:SAM-dependent methyltransferase
MTDETGTWHYGLMAEHWGEHLQDAPELPYFEKEIARFGQPVLDLACGAGRLLLPLLESKIEVDGCDMSRDMLDQCRLRAAEKGLNPNLYKQPMYTFKLQRKYRTIYICDSFDLAGSRDNGLATLQRCYEHLHDGGALLLNIQAEYASRASWEQWLPENRAHLPQPWPEKGSRRVAADGSETIAYFRRLDLDPLDQTYTMQVRLEKWVTGERVATEVYTLSGNMYSKNELLFMMQLAGFRDITVYGDYSDESATAEHSEINFVAIK